MGLVNLTAMACVGVQCDPKELMKTGMPSNSINSNLINFFISSSDE